MYDVSSPVNDASLFMNRSVLYGADLPVGLALHYELWPICVHCGIKPTGHRSGWCLRCRHGADIYDFPLFDEPSGVERNAIRKGW